MLPTISELVQVSILAYLCIRVPRCSTCLEMYSQDKIGSDLQWTEIGIFTVPPLVAETYVVSSIRNRPVTTSLTS